MADAYETITEESKKLQVDTYSIFEMNDEENSISPKTLNDVLDTYGQPQSINHYAHSMILHYIQRDRTMIFLINKDGRVSKWEVSF